MHPLRARLLAGLSISVIAGISCTKSHSGPWVPDPKYGICTQTGGCECAVFCTEQPQITATSDAGPLYEQCGLGAKIPASVAKVEGMAGQTAYLHTPGTEDVRKDYPKACCYSYETRPCGKGRPLRDERGLVVASESRRDDWTVDDDAIERAARDLRARFEDLDVLADHLRRTALLEHGSVAAFAHVSLELLALGAPADLVHDAHVAALDEIRHARIAWAMAHAIDGRDAGPSELRMPKLDLDVDRILAATVIEGCVGETLASAHLRACADACAVPAFAEILRQIADDEERHALLAFRIVKFLLRSGARADGVRSALASVKLSASRAPHAPGLGIIGGLEELALHRATMREVIEPVLDALASPVEQPHQVV